MKNYNIIIRYGPYLSCATIEHREDYLQGLQSVLTSAGHSVKLEKMEDRDIVELLVYGEVIYKCNIQSLVFGGDGKLDIKCDEALDAISGIP